MLSQPQQQQQQQGQAGSSAENGDKNASKAPPGAPPGARAYARVSSGHSDFCSDSEGPASHMRMPSNYLPLPPSSDVLIGALAANDPRRSRNRAIGAPLWAQQVCI